jgi:hypothetical protein
MKLAFHTGLFALLATCLLTPLAQAHKGEQTKLLPDDGAAGDHFGASVAITHDMAAVGAPFHLVGPDEGAVYLFSRSTSTEWPQVAKLTHTDGAVLGFGAAVSMDGSYVAVGAPRANSLAGAVYIFTGSGSSWTQTQVLTASDTGAGHAFGRSIELRGDTLAVGAPGNEAAYAFRLVAGTWVEEQKLTATPSSLGDEFGHSVSIYGDEMVVGAPGESSDGRGAGSAFLFQRSGTTWTQSLRFGSLTPGSGDAFGFSVSIHSLFVAVGAPFDDDFGVDSGAGHYFRRSGSSWISEGVLADVAAVVDDGDEAGHAIATHTNLFMVAQPKSDLQGLKSGGSQVFAERLGVLTGDVYFPSDTSAGDELGSSIAVGGCWMMAGAPKDDDLGAESGSAYVFHVAIQPIYYCLPGISSKGCASTLSTSGYPSASDPDGFSVIGSGVEGGIAGTFFFGMNGGQMNPWGNGTSFQCVVPPVIRMGMTTSTGSGTCGGQFSQDFNAVWCSTCPKPAKNPGAGAEIYVQLWYRDPQNTSNQTTSLSNAARLYVCP